MYCFKTLYPFKDLFDDILETICENIRMQRIDKFLNIFINSFSEANFNDDLLKTIDLDFTYGLDREI